MTWTKRHCVANITIQSVKLPNEIQDPFQVEWKRSDVSGMTEREFANSDNEVVFAKRFRFRIKMYIKKKDQTVRPKCVAFTVLRFVDSKQRKVFGTCQVDLSQFYNKPAPIDSTFEIESPHSQKSYLILSAIVSGEKHKRNSLPERPEEEIDLNSLSEAIQLTTDRQEEWDMSETVTEEDKQRINMFFMKRQEGHMRTDALENFMTTPIERRSKHRRAIPLRVQIEQDGDAGASQFNSVQVGDTDKPVLADFLSAKPKSRGRLSRKSLSGLMVRQGLDLIPPSVFENEKDLEISPEDSAKNLLRSVLNKHWCDSPVPVDQVPKPAVAIYAALLYTNVLKENVLDDDAFAMICADFDERYRTSSIAANITEMDRFVISLNLIAMLDTGSFDLDITRVQTFTKVLCDVCGKCAESIVESLWTPFESIVVRLIEEVSDGETFISELLKVIADLKQHLPPSDQLAEYFHAVVIERIDAGLVNALLDRPSSCTFMKAATWNATATILSSDHHVELPMFKASISCLTMSQALCHDPAESNAICPGIPPHIVLKLLDNQTPDDCMPITNDTSEFARYYGLATSQEAPSRVSVTFEGFQPLAAGFDTANWLSTKFDQHTMDSFKYLSTYFS